MSNAGNPPPGWYPDPSNTAQQRFWDGSGWTEQTQAAAPTPPPTPPPAQPPTAPTPAAQPPTAQMPAAQPPATPPPGATPTPPPGATPPPPGATPPPPGGPTPPPPGAFPPAGAGGAGSGGGGRGKIIALVVGVIGVLALIGGGLALALGGGGGTETLDDDELADHIDDVCNDFDRALDDIDDDYELDTVEALEELDDDERDEVVNATDEARTTLIDELSSVQPEDNADDWETAVDDFDEALEAFFTGFIAGEDDDEIADLSEDLNEAVVVFADDFDAPCLSEGEMMEPVDPPEPPETTTTPTVTAPPTTEPDVPDDFGPPVEPFAGIEAEHEANATACYEGDMAACDDLWLTTRVGSPGEEYGALCGGRSPVEISNDCEELITDPILPEGNGGGNGGGDGANNGGGGNDGNFGPPVEPFSDIAPEHRELADECYQGDMASCDRLWATTPIDSPGEAYGAHCGGRSEERIFNQCEEQITDPIPPGGG